MSVHKLIHLLYFSDSFNPEKNFLSSSTEVLCVNENDDYRPKTAQKRNLIWKKIGVREVIPPEPEFQADEEVTEDLENDLESPLCYFRRFVDRHFWILLLNKAIYI